MFEHSEQIRLFQSQWIYIVRERKKQSNKVGPANFKMYTFLLCLRDCKKEGKRKDYLARKK
jgi:hypothetical protein